MLTRMPEMVFYLPIINWHYRFRYGWPFNGRAQREVVSLLYGMINHLPTKVAEKLEDWSDNIYTDDKCYR